MPVTPLSEPVAPAQPDGLDHDHERLCCSAHGTHAMPHVGCVLR